MRFRSVNVAAGSPGSYGSANASFADRILSPGPGGVDGRRGRPRLAAGVRRDAAWPNEAERNQPTGRKPECQQVRHRARRDEAERAYPRADRPFGRLRRVVLVAQHSRHAEEAAWAWQIDGHHVIVNCFVLGNQVVLTWQFPRIRAGFRRLPH